MLDKQKLGGLTAMAINPLYQRLIGYQEYGLDEMKLRSGEFRSDLQRRRTVRHFSDRPVPREIIEDCVGAAASAPSGANMQPWHFVVISDQTIKAQIREAAEKEERAFYARRASSEWLEALMPLGVDENKPFLDVAPYIIAIFAQTYGLSPDGSKIKHYYVYESVGIATGILITAIHKTGLVSLTHTPSPMGFLKKILRRPANERPFLLLAVGYPSEGATVPRISRKMLHEVNTFV